MNKLNALAAAISLFVVVIGLYGIIILKNHSWINMVATICFIAVFIISFKNINQ